MFSKIIGLAACWCMTLLSFRAISVSNGLWAKKVRFILCRGIVAILTNGHLVWIGPLTNTSSLNTKMPSSSIRKKWVVWAHEDLWLLQLRSVYLFSAVKDLNSRSTIITTTAEHRETSWNEDQCLHDHMICLQTANIYSSFQVHIIQ